MSTSENRSILCGMTERMGEPRAVLDTATHAYYFPVTVLEAVQGTLSGTRPQAVDTTEKQEVAPE